MKESPKDGRRAENARKKKNKKARKVAGILLAVFAAVFAVVAAICFALPRNEEPQSPSEPTETPSSSSPTDTTEGTSASDEPTNDMGKYNTAHFAATSILLVCFCFKSVPYGATLPFERYPGVATAGQTDVP